MYTVTTEGYVYYNNEVIIGFAKTNEDVMEIINAHSNKGFTTGGSKQTNSINSHID